MIANILVIGGISVWQGICWVLIAFTFIGAHFSVQEWKRGERSSVWGSLGNVALAVANLWFCHWLRGVWHTNPTAWPFLGIMAYLAVSAGFTVFIFKMLRHEVAADQGEPCGGGLLCDCPCECQVCLEKCPDFCDCTTCCDCGDHKQASSK